MAANSRKNLILASGSAIRQEMLRNAGVEFHVATAKVDEAAIRAALLAERANPWDIADALAEAKARKVSAKEPEALVIGCDQVLDFGGEIISKPRDREELREHLERLSGQRHRLLSAVVIYEDGQPVWRHVGVVRLQMREISAGYLNEYLERNTENLMYSAGGYQLESEGVRLFAKIEGDYFTVLGLPLVELLGYLTARGVIFG
ncbi:MAG: Maf family nucleotide pyrophosphatase [Paracoccaceae bacterium]|nr:Maf family nucleotide pyrophosphatase [Paracoccaceae bacterium]